MNEEIPKFLAEEMKNYVSFLNNENPNWTNLEHEEYKKFIYNSGLKYTVHKAEKDNSHDEFSEILKEAQEGNLLNDYTTEEIVNVYEEFDGDTSNNEFLSRIIDIINIMKGMAQSNEK